MIRDWTSSQKRAIDIRGGSVLVSAAAGSGKTAVLVERIISLITNREHPVPADRLLVVTYTNSAAGEMSSRVRASLARLIAHDPTNTFLRRQASLARRAQISTVHSFCAKLLREHFSELDIPPDFTIADDALASRLHSTALESVLANAYSDAESGIEELSDLFGKSRTDSTTADLIERLYEFETTLSDPRAWENEALLCCDSAIPFSETTIAQSLFDYAERALVYTQTVLSEALELCSDDEILSANYTDALESDKLAASLLQALVTARRWDDCVAAAHRYSPARLGGRTREADPVAREAAKALRDEAKSLLSGKLSDKCFSFTELEYAKDCERLSRPLRSLFDITNRYSRELFKLKRERRQFEFSDLERLTLTLLVDESGNPTPAALETAARFDCILVDEYQDTNRIQDAIFSSITPSSRNLFLVGDVKQSIYGFRRADPEIFIERAQASMDVETGLFPAKIDLRENFRSSRNVIDGCNAVFCPLMTRRLGGADYEADGGLEPSKITPPGEGAGIEFQLVTEPGKEPYHIARKISDMLESRYTIETSDGVRPCRESDFCILLRAANNKAQPYIDALEAEGVHAWTGGGDNLFACSEVQILLSLLRVIDNPRRDVELAAVMLSPLFDFTTDDLARLRVDDRSSPLFALALSRAADEPRFSRLADTLSRLRTASCSMSAGELTRECVDSLDADLLLCAGDDYSRRLDNIRRFLSFADSASSLSDDSLQSFLRICERAQQNKSRLARAFSPPADAVCVASVHKSKGLEWPVIIFANADGQFNRTDSRDTAMLFSHRLGAGARIKLPAGDSSTLYAHKTAGYLALSLAADERSASEEMRLLYVALTRARQKIIITGACTNPDKTLGAICAGVARAQPDPFALAYCSNPLKQLLTAAFYRLGSPALEALLERGEYESYPLRMSIEGCSAATAPLEKTKKITTEVDSELSAAIERRFTFRSPLTQLSELPSKLSVTELAKNETSSAVLYRPSFARGTLTAAERGTALHVFMQCANYSKAAQSVADELQRLVEEKYISERTARGVDIPSLDHFFKTELGLRVVRAPRVLREFEFIDTIDANSLLPEPCAEHREVLVQGIADCVLLEDSGAVLVDYKTDRVNDPSILIERYSAQLALYRAALDKRLETPVKESVIYSFSLGHEIQLFV
ncbi:MAG: UvrD-helicase domain-containing protein [Oscillospiraceae bacterium]